MTRPDGDAAKLVAKCVEERESHLAQVYFSTARFEEALSILAPLAAQRTSNPSYPCRQVMCLLAINRVDEAAEIIAEVVKSAPYYALGQLLFAQVELMKGNTESANAILFRIKEAEAHMPMVHLHVAMTSIRQGQWEAAAETCRRILEIDPDSAGAHDSLGVALRHLGSYEDAVYEHMRAASLQHDRAQTHVNLGLSLIRPGRSIGPSGLLGSPLSWHRRSRIRTAVSPEFIGGFSRIVTKRGITCCVRENYEENLVAPSRHFVTEFEYA